MRRPIGTLIELLAAIPSIIYGIWGLFVLAPFLQLTVQPALVSTLGELPIIGALFAGPPLGLGVLTAGVILGFMVLPFIASVMRDVFATVPPMLRESAYGVGATTAEVVRHIVLPYTRVGVIGGIMLGLGRALGETMAVTFVIGNAHRVKTSLLAPGTTISATLANEFTEAVGDLYTSALFALGFILFVITFIVLAAAKLIGTPVGVLTGTYLAEFGGASRVASAVRFINDVLLSAPSIIIGLFVYGLLVVPLHHFSAWAGSVALAIIVVPVVVRTTEDMLRLVPATLREAAVALGAPQWKVIVLVTYRAALQGMLTGVMLAVARIAGETAPLLFTSLNNQFWSVNMNAPMANLPVVIFQFALSPYADWQELAWGGAMLITLTILLLNILARALASWSNHTS